MRIRCGVITLWAFSVSGALGAGESPCPGIAFDEESELYPVPFGVGPSSVSIGDLTGDGIADIVVADAHSTAGSQAVVVLPGDGDGTFGEAYFIDCTVSASAVRVGDLDGDGDDDLVVNGFDGLAVRVNRGGGTFDPPIYWSYTNGFGDLAFVDADDDGITDIVATGSYLEGIHCFRGLGGGAFADPVFSPIDVQTNGLDVADFNNDGVPDAALTILTRDEIVVALGDGNGGFAEIARAESAGNPVSVRSGDFDRDGNADLAALHHLNNNLTFYFGNGDGTVSPPNFRSTPNGGFAYPQALAVTDFDRDGFEDLITASGAGGVTIFLGGADGGFHNPREYAGGEVGVTGIAVADLDSDGDLDAVATDITFGVGVHVALNACRSLCSGADMARPYGDQDLGDISTFVAYFTASDPIADLNRDDTLDLADIVSFVSQFSDDCPDGGD